MTPKYYRLLRSAILIMGFLFTSFFIFRIISQSGEILSFENYVVLIRGIILMTIGLTIVIKLPRANEHIFFALFLVNFACTSWLAIGMTYWIADTFIWALTAGSFVYAMIKYPGAQAASLYAEYFARKRSQVWYKGAVLYFTQEKHFWLLYFPALILLRASGHFISGVFLDALNIVVNISGLIYFRISYNLAGKTDRSRLAWILWGVVVTLVVTLIELLIRIFYPEASAAIFQVTFALTSATISISIIMGVFFAGFLDSGLVLRGTIVYSVIFLSVVFLFSFVEHFIEQGIATLMHIENDMVSAFLAGFLALLIQPLHNKLESKLPKF